MNCKYFIICQFDVNRGTKFHEARFNYLTGWRMLEEEGDWSSNPIRAMSFESYSRFLSDYVRNNSWSEPYFFDTIEEAKNAIRTIRAYDIPDEHCFNIRYYLVKSEVRTIPTEALEFLPQ